MTVDNPGVIDIIADDPEGKTVYLIIADHLSWDDELDHLLKLQDKINHYVHFIETGQIYDAHPSAKGKEVVIQIVGKYPLKGAALEFFNAAKRELGKYGIELIFRHLDP